MPPQTANIINARSRAGYKAYTMPVFALLLSVTLAYTQPLHTDAAGLSFGYGTNPEVVEGMIVSVNPEDTDSVISANGNNADYVVGIAVNQASSSVVFDNDDPIHVATDGNAQVFVSTQGGDIAAGDLITVSNISGVGRKKDPNAEGQKIVGVATESFSIESLKAETYDLENAGNVTIGLINVDILVGEQASGDRDSGESDNVLVRIGRQIAGKPVSLSQVMITASIVILAFVISGAVLFGAIKGGFISIGRNPLSSKAIYSGMIRTILVSLSIMMLGIVAGYVVLIL